MHPTPTNHTESDVNRNVDTVANNLYQELSSGVYQRTDKLFAIVFMFQWFLGVVFALTISPRTWAGTFSTTHIHVWAAVVLGLIIISLPLYLIATQPGKTITRHSIAVGQLLTSVLLIHLTGGRIETHFHVFGSLAFLAYYRDWRVLLTATIVTAADHYFRGVYWPQSAYGIITGREWRWLEHAAWVIFEDVFLVYGCIQGRKEWQQLSTNQAKLQIINTNIEQTVSERTGELETKVNELNIAQEKIKRSERFSHLMHEISIYAVHADKAHDIIQFAINKLCGLLNYDIGHVYEVSEADINRLEPTSIWYFSDTMAFIEFRNITMDTSFQYGEGMPGRILEFGKPFWIEDIATDDNFPRNLKSDNLGVHGCFGFPVKIKGETVFILEFFTKGVFEPNPEVIALIGNVCEHVSRVLEKHAAEINLLKTKQDLETSLADSENLRKDAIKLAEQAQTANQAKDEFLANMRPRTAYPLKRRIRGNPVITRQQLKPRTTRLLPYHHPVR